MRAIHPEFPALVGQAGRFCPERRTARVGWRAGPMHEHVMYGRRVLAERSSNAGTDVRGIADNWPSRGRFWHRVPGSVQSNRGTRNLWARAEPILRVRVTSLLPRRLVGLDLIV